MKLKLLVASEELTEIDTFDIIALRLEKLTARVV